MLDLFAMLLSSIWSFLFPIFASYKALKTSDPAQLTPWLMYWVVFSICLLVESWFSFILFWIPFYGYIRLLFLFYLVSPQTQGARVLYETKVHPFLRDNENAIDEFISKAHDRLKTAGLAYFRRAIDFLKTKVLNMPATAPAEPASQAPAQGYTQSLLARFSVPTARWASAAYSGNDFYNMLAGAVSAATSASGSSGAHARRASGNPPETLIPPHVRSPAERISFITAQRERLTILLGALDREAQQIQRDGSDTVVADEEDTSQRPASGMSMSSALGPSRSRSETDFEKVEAESGGEDEGTLRRRQVSSQGTATGGSWSRWGWSMGGGSGSSGSGGEGSRKED